MIKNDAGYKNKSQGLSLQQMAPVCGRCMEGHEVVWFVEPPPECPYCNAPLINGGETCSELPLSFLSW